MTTLGYGRFGTAGGDIGSHVSRYLALDHPDRVVAVHRMDAGLPLFAGDASDLTAEERAWLDGGAAWAATEGAYAAMHRTKPQTAAFGLTDSPVGLAAWIVEKLRSWSDCDGDVERCFTKDEILTLVTQQWMSGNIGAAMRMYHANAVNPPRAAQLTRGGPVRLRHLRRRHPASSALLARAHRERRARDRTPERRPLRAVRTARGLRVRAAGVLPSLSRRRPCLTASLAAAAGPAITLGCSGVPSRRARRGTRRPPGSTRRGGCPRPRIP